MNDKEFYELATSHGKLSIGLFTKEVVNVGGIEVNIGFKHNDVYNTNIGVIAVDSPQQLDLPKALEALTKLNPKAGIYLSYNDMERGFLEYFIRNGMKFEHGDTWMLYDFSSGIDNEPKHEIVEVDEGNFADFRHVLGTAYKGFLGNEDYLDILESIINKKTNSQIEDLVSKLFLIYDNGKPASGAGLFYSLSENLGYLHDMGTLEEFRGKGYQTSLVNYRKNYAKNLGIKRIYAMVELGGQSWSNLIKQGFKEFGQTHVVRPAV